MLLKFCIIIYNGPEAILICPWLKAAAKITKFTHFCYVFQNLRKLRKFAKVRKKPQMWSHRGLAKTANLTKIAVKIREGTKTPNVISHAEVLTKEYWICSWSEKSKNSQLSSTLDIRAKLMSIQPRSQGLSSQLLLAGRRETLGTRLMSIAAEHSISM